MNFLSWCKVGYKTETEYLYEIPAFHLSNNNKNLSNYKMWNYYPFLLQQKENKESSLINNLQAESMENSNNYQNNLCDKDYVLQIKKINPVNLPAESEIATNEEEIPSIERKKGNDEKSDLRKRTNSEKKDNNLDIMKLKNMLSDSFKQKELFINNDHFKDELFSVNTSDKKILHKKGKNMSKNKIQIKVHRNYKFNYYKKVKINSISNNKISKNKVLFSSKNLDTKILKKNKATSEGKDYYNKEVSLKKALTNNFTKLNLKNIDKNEKTETMKLPYRKKKIININENKLFNLSNDNSDLKTTNCINNIKDFLSKSIIKYNNRDNSTNFKIRRNSRLLKISINNINTKKEKNVITNNETRKHLSTIISKNNNIMNIIKYKKQNLKKFNKINSQIDIDIQTINKRKTNFTVGIDNPFNDEYKSNNFTKKIRCNDYINTITASHKIRKIIKQRQNTKEKKN